MSVGNVKSQTSNVLNANVLPLGILPAGSSMPLPCGSLNRQNGTSFLIRPASERQHDWSTSIDPRSPVNDLGDICEAKGFLVCCPIAQDQNALYLKSLSDLSQTSAVDPFWMTVNIIGDPLPLANMEMTHDFNILLKPVLRLENSLPFSITFVLYEKQRSVNGLKHLKTVTCDSVSHINLTCVDPRRAVYMTACIDDIEHQWVNGASPVLIYGAGASERAKSICLRSRIGTDLRIQILYDHAENENEVIDIPIVRFSVPLWIKNNTNTIVHFATVPKRRIIKAEPSTSPRQKEMIPYFRCYPGPEKLQDERFVLCKSLALHSPGYTFDVHNLELRIRLGTGGSSPAIPINDNLGLPTVIEAICEDGESYQVVVTVDVGPGNLQGVKIISVDPHVTISNRSGISLDVRQVVVSPSGIEHIGHILSLPRLGMEEAVINWTSGSGVQNGGMLQIRESDPEGEWSMPFRVLYPGGNEVFLTRQSDMNEVNDLQEAFRVVIQLKSPGRLKIQIETGYSRSQYSLVNFSSSAISYRQSGPKEGENWKSLDPYVCHSFTWNIPHGEKVFEIRDRNGIVEYIPMSKNRRSQKKKTLKFDAIEDLILSIRKSDSGSTMLHFFNDNRGTVGDESSIDYHNAASNLSFALQIFSFKISVVDKVPEELVLISIEELMLTFSNSYLDTRFGFRIRSFQIDDQLRDSHSPTMLLHRREQNNFSGDFLKGSIIISSEGSSRRIVVLSYVGLELTGNIMVSIYEPVVWRLLKFIGDAADKLTSVLSIGQDHRNIEISDRMLQVSILTLPDILVRLSYKTSVKPIDRGVKGIAYVGLSLANIEGAKISIRGLTLENATMPESALTQMITDNIVKQVMGQSLTLLANYKYLDNTSKALGQASTGLALISMDERYQRDRNRGNTSQVVGVADGLKDGSEALAKGIFHGVAGIFTKPVEGAKEQGFKGFMKGVGKGVLGAAAKPVAGVFDFASKTTEGISASVDSLSSGISDTVKIGGRSRKRLSRAFSGDRVIRPFSEYEAIGQHVLWACEKGSYFGSDDIFKTKGHFVDDRYESHMEVKHDCVFMITNRRIMLLKRSKRGSILHYPCTVLWSALWQEILSIEIRKKGDDKEGKPSIFTIVLKDTDGTFAGKGRIPEHYVECHQGTTQALELRIVCIKVMDRFMGSFAGGKRRSGDLIASAGASAGAAAGALVGASILAPIAPISIPVCVALGSVIGGYAGAIKGTESAKNPQRKKSKALLSEGQDLLTNEALDQHEDESKYYILSNSKTIEVWSSEGLRGSGDLISIWKPLPPTGFAALGDILQVGSFEPQQPILMIQLDLKVRVGASFIPALRAADDYQLVWRSTNSGSVRPLTIWRPIPPAHYIALGCICIPRIERPDGIQYVSYCVHKSLVHRTAIFDSPLLNLTNSYRGSQKISLFQIDNDCHSFIARRAQEVEQIEVFGVNVSVFKSGIVTEDSDQGQLRRQGGYKD